MREVLWRLPQWAHIRLMDILDQLDEGPTEEEEYALYEDLKCLPDFPLGYTKEDIIHLEVTTEVFH